MQERPQVKKVRRGTAQGSTVKFQDAKHEYGEMEEGLIEALKALSAAMSEAEVRAPTLKMLLQKREK